MQPDLELVHVRKGESFSAWMHGYPFRTVRWHYHPEFEIHLIAATSGKFYMGDFIGRFEPGQLVMIGPNLPHNWISEVEEGEAVPVRSLVIQFPESFINGACAKIAEMEAVQPLLDRCHRGLIFDAVTSAKVRPLFERLIGARGLIRVALFWEILDLLQAGEHEVLASLSYQLDLKSINDSGINRAIAHLKDNLTEQLDEGDLASMVGQSQSAFSRAFKKHTGKTLVRYRNQLRVDLACQLLLLDPTATVAEICYEVGFSNLSNFNRHFQNFKGMPPSKFKATFAANKGLAMTA
jgi:AraC-like DNA-binding protein/mannose-6-phosphate isomerase-like protein (cupin superfamily)